MHLSFRQITRANFPPALLRLSQTTRNPHESSEVTGMTPTRPTAESLPIPSLAPIPTPTPSTPPHDPLDKSTFLPPNFTPSHSSPAEELPRVVIEFCDRCRWLSRATWTLTELFLTFPPISLDVPLDPIDGEVEEGRTERKESGLKAISLLPRSAPETGGRFRVWLYRQKGEGVVEEFEGWGGAELVWDRKLEGGFPEMKELVRFLSSLYTPWILFSWE